MAPFMFLLLLGARCLLSLELCQAQSHCGAGCTVASDCGVALACISGHCVDDPDSGSTTCARGAGAGCNTSCTAETECPGQLICSKGQCTDDLRGGTSLCSASQSSPHNAVTEAVSVPLVSHKYPTDKLRTRLTLVKPAQAFRRLLARRGTVNAARRRPRPVAKPGPCSRKYITVHVRREADFKARLRYSPRRTVQLAVHTPILLSKGLVFNARFSCTILKSVGRNAPLNLTYAKFDMPALTIINASNVWVQGINIIAHTVDVRLARPCDFELFSGIPNAMAPGHDKDDLTCPGIYVANSYGVQINQAFIYGRIDVFRAMKVLLDRLKVTGPKVYLARPKPFYSKDEWTTHGFIRMGETSAGPSLLPSGNIISNCEVYDGWELITLHRGAMGVLVTNNYLHHFAFSGITCGEGASAIFVCHLNNFTRNYISNPPGYKLPPQDQAGEVAGIYTCGHWFNPGNYMSCNYIFNVDWCIYLDFATSGTTIDGGVCNGTHGTVKVNGGKFNKIKSVIGVQPTEVLTFYSCITVPLANCFSASGNRWEVQRRAYWDTPYINHLFPEMATICNPIKSAINGYSCNPQGQLGSTATGYCSGFPYGNVDKTFLYYAGTHTFVGTLDACTTRGNFPGVNTTAFNKAVWYNVTENPGFTGGSGHPSTIKDYGLLPSSRIYKLDPGFTSCPKSKVGPRWAAPGKLFPTKKAVLPIYKAFFNLREPGSFKAMLSFPLWELFNYSLPVIPKESFKIER